MRKNFPNGNRFARDISWLRGVDALDARGARLFRWAARRYRSFLVVGGHLAGKNTVADALSGFMHEHGREPMILPTLEGVSLKSIADGGNWKTYRALLRHGLPSVVVAGYRAQIPDDRDLRRLGRGFDVILDVRRLAGGRRAVCRILVQGARGLRCVYEHPSLSERALRHRRVA